MRAQKSPTSRYSFGNIRTNHYSSLLDNSDIELSSSSSSPWDGKSQTQSELMERDTVLVTDFDDNVISSASKRSSHEFSADNPHGILHRAFSVFLFDQSTNELLLQKRASTKITFPNVWTNTCCSHPLHGMDPHEVDSPHDVSEGKVLGAMHGAVRKLEHELGIPRGELDVDMEGGGGCGDFKFLTRVHYWAADTVTHGEDSPWGEHEIDYILFVTVSSKDVLTLKPHPDEVDDIRWVSKKQLMDMFDDKTLLFSPWFRIIANRWLIGDKNGSGENDVVVGGGGKGRTVVGGWWDDLDTTMKTDVFCDYETIHRFDPPGEHAGGAGNAAPLFGGV